MDQLQPTWVEIARALDRKRCQELTLVLEAVGIPHAAAHHLQAWVVLVPEVSAERAREELARYERENRGWPPREAFPVSHSDGWVLTMLYAGVLLCGYLAPRRFLLGFDWAGAGKAHAERILAGEWWQAITALTLHADLVHLAGNLLFGAVFLVLLAHSVGSGLAALCFVLTGALGNWVNALLQPGTHVSIGASTAVFGVLGAQAAYQFMRRKDGRMPAWRQRVPLIAGLVLLGWLGLGGLSHDPSDVAEESRKLSQVLEKTDVIAHFTGFAAGIVLGAALGWKRRLPRFGPRTEAALGAGALALILLGWVLALRHGAS